jgi:hypothetical protein
VFACSVVVRAEARKDAKDLTRGPMPLLRTWPEGQVLVASNEV